MDNYVSKRFDSKSPTAIYKKLPIYEDPQLYQSVRDIVDYSNLTGREVYGADSLGNVCMYDVLGTHIPRNEQCFKIRVQKINGTIKTDFAHRAKLTDNQVQQSELIIYLTELEKHDIFLEQLNVYLSLHKSHLKSKHPLAANTIDLIMDKYLFILNFIQKNLFIISE